MGKNYLQQAEYDYINDNKPVKGNLLQRLLYKFRRYNFDIGNYRHLRNKIRYKPNKDVEE